MRNGAESAVAKEKVETIWDYFFTAAVRHIISDSRGEAFENHFKLPYAKRMKNSKIIIVVVVLAVAVAGYFKYKSHPYSEVSELQKTDIKVGDGASAEKGKRVTVHYTGWLVDGKKFDSSHDHGSPFTFMLGAHQVISGWDQGVEGMKVGGSRRLLIPSKLGYGPTGAGNVIPPNATLVFEVELLKIE